MSPTNCGKTRPGSEDKEKMGVTGNEEENGKLEIRVGEVGWHLWCATAPSNRTQKAAWTPSDWRPFKNRLVIGLGHLHVLPQRQERMTLGSHWAPFSLLLQHIESSKKPPTGQGWFSLSGKRLGCPGVRRLEYDAF